MLPTYRILKLVKALSSRLLGVVFLLALNLILANGFDQKDFGHQMILYTAVMFIGNIGTLGVNRLVILLAKRKGTFYYIKEYRSLDITKLISLFYLALLLIVILSSAFIDLIIGSFKDCIFVLFAAYFLSLTLIRTSNLLIANNTSSALIIQNSTIPALSLFLYFLLPRDFYSSNFASLLLVSSLLAFLMSTVHPKGRQVVFSKRTKANNSLVVSTASFCLVIFAEMYFVWGISLIASFSISTEEYGTLNIIQRISSALLLILMVSTMVTMPDFSFLKESRTKIQKAHIGSVIACFAVTLPAILFLFYFTEFILSLFGNGYVEYSSLCRVFITFVGVAVALGPSSSVLMMIGKSKSVNIANSVAVALSIPLVYLSIYTYSLTGAVISISLSFLLSKALIFCMAIHYIHFNRNDIAAQ